MQMFGPEGTVGEQSRWSLCFYHPGAEMSRVVRGTRMCPSAVSPGLECTFRHSCCQRVKVLHSDSPGCSSSSSRSFGLVDMCVCVLVSSHPPPPFPPPLLFLREGVPVPLTTPNKWGAKTVKSLCFAVPLNSVSAKRGGRVWGGETVWTRIFTLHAFGCSLCFIFVCLCGVFLHSSGCQASLAKLQLWIKLDVNENSALCSRGRVCHLPTVQNNCEIFTVTKFTWAATSLLFLAAWWTG